MNKAFVREGDEPAPRCGCGSAGLSVEPAQVGKSTAGRAALSGQAFFCPRPVCPVAFYDGWGTQVAAALLEVPCYPKDPEGFVCPCLQIRLAEIRDEAREGGKETVMRILQHLKSEPGCAELRPDGRTCEREARRLFLEHRSGGDGPV